MTESQLTQIHDYMVNKVTECNGRIDKIYHSPHMAESNHHLRKPNPGMAMKAAKDFPEISFKRSVMLGDSLSDMEFAQSVGMKAVFIGNPEEMGLISSLFDLDYASFFDFIKDLNSLDVIQ
jgi:HAD superfamily hydrolase (TIGR01662 family)